MNGIEEAAKAELPKPADSEEGPIASMRYSNSHDAPNSVSRRRFRIQMFDQHSGLNSGASLREHRLQETGISPPDAASAETRHKLNPISARNSERLFSGGFRNAPIGGTENRSGNRQRLIKAIDTQLMASR